MLFLSSIRDCSEGPGSVSRLKNQALSETAEGRMKGDAALEYRGQTILAELAMEPKDWEAAAQHIFRIVELSLQFSGGNVLFSSPHDRALRWMRYGCAMLQAWELKNALIFFRMSGRDRDGKIFEGDDLQHIKDPEKFMQGAVDRVRHCLGLLVSPPTKLITVEEYYELDDLMQELVIKNIERRFPDFDLEENRIRERLRRLDSSTDLETRLIEAAHQQDDRFLENTLASSLSPAYRYPAEATDEGLLDLSRLNRETPSLEDVLAK